ADSRNRLLTPTELTYYEIFAAHYTKPVPEGQPDPYVGSGWVPITRFFGHGTTWSSTVPALHDLTAAFEAPAVMDLAIAPATLHFSRIVHGLDLGDLRLTHDGADVDLSGASLTTADGVTWTLSGLSSHTAALGQYRLSLAAPASGIRDSAGNGLAADAAVSWTFAGRRTTTLLALTSSGQLLTA